MKNNKTSTNVFKHPPSIKLTSLALFSPGTQQVLSAVSYHLKGRKALPTIKGIKTKSQNHNRLWCVLVPLNHYLWNKRGAVWPHTVITGGWDVPETMSYRWHWCATVARTRGWTIWRAEVPILFSWTLLPAAHSPTLTASISLWMAPIQALWQGRIAK